MTPNKLLMAFHPLADLFPLIEGAEFDELVADIEQNGLHENIVTFENAILDGRNRYRALLKTKRFEKGKNDGEQFFIPFTASAFGPEIVSRGPLAFVLSKNLRRRHLNESQRAMVAARLANMRQGERNDLNEPSANLPKVDQASAAKALNVSPRLVRDAKSVRENGSAELAGAVEKGMLSVSTAAQAAKFGPDVQAEIVKEAEAGRGNVVRTVIKKRARTAREAQLGMQMSALPDKRYGVILADPEWKFAPYSENGMDRSPGNHYPVSETKLIAARDIASIAAPDCVLFLWATAPMLEDAILVMNAWGFSYKSQCIWKKKRQGNARGNGYWFHVEHEILLVGTRGKPPAPAPGTQWSSVINAPVGKHSEKPPVFHELIETYFPKLPKIELNARTRRKGWDAWGNELPDMPTASAPALPAERRRSPGNRPSRPRGKPAPKKLAKKSSAKSAKRDRR